MSYDFHGAWHQYVHHNAPLDIHPMDLTNEIGIEEENQYFSVVSPTTSSFKLTKYISKKFTFIFSEVWSGILGQAWSTQEQAGSWYPIVWKSFHHGQTTGWT